MLLLMSKVDSYDGYKEPEKVKVNDRLDMYIYIPLDLEKDYMVGLVRNFEFRIDEPFLMLGETVQLIQEKLCERGLN